MSATMFGYPAQLSIIMSLAEKVTKTATTKPANSLHTCLTIKKAHRTKNAEKKEATSA